jgi:hypothetical protein
MSKPSAEALLRYPQRGHYDGQPCVCTRTCPAACDGKKCGCEACLRSWLDHNLDELYPRRLA